MKSWSFALLVFLAGCCYGILSTFVKFAYAAGFSAKDVTGSQFLIGTLLIWIAVIFTKKQKMTLRNISKLLLSGIPLGLTGVFYYHSLQTLSASLGIIFLFQFVWIGTLFEWVFHKKKPSFEKTVSIIVLLIGSVFAAGVIGNGWNGFSWQGIIWGMLSAITYTLFLFLSSTVGKDTPPVLKSAIFSTGGLIVVFTLFPPTFIFHPSILAGVAPYGLYLGVFGVVLPPLLFSIGMPHVGPGLGTILTTSELPVAVMMSAFVLHEQVQTSQWLGVIMILAGIALGNSKLKRKTTGTVLVAK